MRWTGVGAGTGRLGDVGQPQCAKVEHLGKRVCGGSGVLKVVRWQVAVEVKVVVAMLAAVLVSEQNQGALAVHPLGGQGEWPQRGSSPGRCGKGMPRSAYRLGGARCGNSRFWQCRSLAYVPVHDGVGMV